MNVLDLLSSMYFALTAEFLLLLRRPKLLVDVESANVFGPCYVYMRKDVKKLFVQYRNV